MNTSKIKILHISNDFAGSTVHKCLYSELDKLGVEQLVYCPVRDSQLIGKNNFVGKNTWVDYANIIKPYHKYFYHIKQWRLYNYIRHKYDLSTYDLCHASTLLSDGGIAYRIYQKYHIPYIVAVRSTDMDIFLAKLPHTWLDARRILLNAKYIVFINNGLKASLEKHKAILPIIEQIKDRFIIVPNGIDDYYVNHWHSEKHQGHGLVYIGDFSRRKNVLRLCLAVLELKKNETLSDVKLTLIGGGKARNGASEDVEETEEFIRSHPETFVYVGPIYDKDKIIEILNQNTIFAMPSINETFGLVYIEALSQNLALLYTKGQGIDGLFDSKIGIAVNPLSVHDIKNALEKMLINRFNYSNEDINPQTFCWANIANTYKNYYCNLIK